MKEDEAGKGGVCSSGMPGYLLSSQVNISLTLAPFGFILAIWTR